jgi:hypothetical protein
VSNTPLLTGGSKIASFSPLSLPGQTIPPALCSSCGKLPLLEQVHHGSSCGKPHHFGASTPLVHPGGAHCWYTLRPHPSHLPTPGKPHYHIWGSTSHVHPQGALLGLVLAWAPYLLSLWNTPFTNGSSTPLLHPLHPPLFLWQTLTVGSGPMPLPHLPSFWMLAYLTVMDLTRAPRVRGPHFCYLWGHWSINGRPFARRDGME